MPEAEATPSPLSTSKSKTTPPPATTTTSTTTPPASSSSSSSPLSPIISNPPNLTTHSFHHAAIQNHPRAKHHVKSLFNEHDNDWPTVDLGNLITDLDADIKQTASIKMSVNNNPMAVGNSSNSTNNSSSSSSSNCSTASSGNNSGVGKMALPLVSSKLSAPPNKHLGASSNIGTCLQGGSATATITESRSILDGGGNEKGLKMKIKRNKTSINHGGSSSTISSCTSTVTSSSGTSTHPPKLVEPNNSTVMNSPTSSAAVGASPSLKPEGGVSKTSTSSMSGSEDPHPEMKSNSNNAVNEGKSVPSNLHPKLVSSKLPLNVKAGNTPSSPSSLSSNSKQTVNGSTSSSGGENSSSTSSTSDGSTSQASNNCSSVKSSNSFLKIDASVGTEIGTMTEPDCLGPLDPGTSVTLEGIVWHETEGGVLVINVTWRGKTYVGTLLDSTQHVNQWAPPRYSESPTAEIDNKKGRGNKRSGRPGSEPELTRKNLRSSKGKPLKNAINSPSKRKKGYKDEDSNDSTSSTLKRQRTSSKNNSADENDDGVDSEKESSTKDLDSPSISSSKEKEHVSQASTPAAGTTPASEGEMTPKDPKEVKYIPPPPLPYALTCPSPGCKKRYRQHNGLRFHISHSHKELLDSKGEIRDTSDIDKCEKEAKERLRKRGILLEGEERHENNCVSESSSNPLESGRGGTAEVCNGGSKEDDKNVTESSELPSMETEPAPLGLMTTTAGSHCPSGATVSTASSESSPLFSQQAVDKHPGLSSGALPNISGSTMESSKESLNGSHSAGLLTKDESSAPHHSNSVQSSEDPKRGIEGPLSLSSSSFLGNSSSPGDSVSALPNNANNSSNNLSNHAKSPAYSDISDDGGEDDAKKNSMGNNSSNNNNSADLKLMKNKGIPPPTSSSSLPPVLPPSSESVVSSASLQSSHLAPPPPPPPPQPTSSSSSSNNHFPFTPYIPSTTAASITTTTSSSFKPEVSSSVKASSSAPILPHLPPGSSDYQKMLQAYGFPQFSPYSPGIDPSLHLHMMNSDPNYKAKFDKERSDKEKAAHLKDQLDREQKDRRRSSLGITPPPPSKAPEDLRKPLLPSPRSMISVKPEFNVPKSEPGRKTPQTNKDEGAKPTMETRGPPPASINPYGYLHPSLMRPPMGLSYEALAAAAASGSINPLLLSPNPYMPNPYLPPHLPPSMRPPYGGAPDLLRGSSYQPPPQGPEDLSRSVSVGPPSGGSNSSSSVGPPNNPSSTKALDLLQQHASQYYSNSHKIHELSDQRSMKSPSEKGNKESSGSSASSRKRTPSPASTGSLGGGLNRSRSPPPLRHVHTHTHTHFGLGYPLLHPPGGVPPPAAHTPFSPGSYPSHLLPPSGGKGSLPGGPLGQGFPPPPPK